MNTQVQAIAQHLNLAEELILEIQEWAKVLWVRIKGGGSPKQVSWVYSIRGYAIERWLAPAVDSGEMTFDAAVSILKNPDAKYWINNRKEWGMK